MNNDTTTRITGCSAMRRRGGALLLAMAPVLAHAGGVDRFQLTDLDLRDAHVFVDFIFCNDITDVTLAGFSVNGELQAAITTDGDMDGFLDQSYVIDFMPLDQGAASGTASFGESVCTAPLAGSTCGPSFATSTFATTLQTPVTPACLTPLAGTLRPYSPAVTNTTGPCFASAPFSVTLDVGGLPITLQDVRVAATFDGNPATHLVNGLMTGFLDEDDADATVIPAAFPLVGGQALSSLLAGGTGACAAHNDVDIRAGQRGWWMYLNFTAQRLADAPLPDDLFANGFE